MKKRRNALEPSRTQPFTAKEFTMTAPTLHPDVHIGHVHLRVADVQRALEFYRDVLGFGVFADLRPLGIQVAFLAAGAYHHHIALNASETAADATPPPTGHRGLHHIAIVFPNREEWRGAVKRLLACDYPITSAYDHQATVSVFLKDPEGIPLELYYDRPRHEWFDAAGRPILKNERLELSTLLGGG